MRGQGYFCAPLPGFDDFLTGLAIIHLILERC